MSDEDTLPAPPEAIRALDQNGKEVLIPRAEWAEQVLPNMLSEAWDAPDQLYLVLANSLNAGFFAEMEEASARLYEIDTIAARGASMRGIVLHQLGRIDEAEAILTGYVAAHGEEPSILLNLAKAQAAKGENELAQSTLWRTLELDPNLDVALAWFASTAQESGGDAAAQAALELLRARPGSWRAQLWLARGALDAKEFAAARGLYAEALDQAPRPVPAELLMQMSGDLGGRGQLRDLVELTAPHFDAAAHGMPVGNNLMKAHFDLGELAAAEAIRQSLTVFDRPDWRGALEYWGAEIAKRRAVPEGDQPIQIGMLRVDGPVWLPSGSRAAPVFGAKAEGAATVTFLGGTAEAPESVTPEVADSLGRLTRSLPLYLAEQTHLRTAAAGRAMLPWAVGAEGGFVVSESRWPDATAVQAVTEPANLSDYVVTVHIDAEVEPWTAMLAFLRAADGARIGEIEVEFAPNAPEAELPRLAGELVELLSSLGPGSDAAAYVVPEGPPFRAYLVQLERLLAVRCATMEGIPAQFLTHEHALVEAAFALAEATPKSVPTRLLLLETLGAMERLRPEVAGEFRERLMQLMRVHPLPLLDGTFTPSA